MLLPPVAPYLGTGVMESYHDILLLSKMFGGVCNVMGPWQENVAKICMASFFS